LEIPPDRWHTITMDWMTEMPVTEEGFDALLVVVDKLTKYVVLIPCRMTDGSTQVAHLLMERVFTIHGFPRKIVCDRDRRLDCNFFRKWTESLGIHLAMSSAYHPQTDGQTERMNRLVAEVLRHYVMPDLHTWNQHLPAVAWAINNSYHTATRNTPFFLNRGAHPALPGKLQLDTNAPAAAAMVQVLADGVRRTRQLLADAASRMKCAADAKRRPLVFKVGEKVLLRSTNFKFKGEHTRKLMPRFLGPFEVVKVVGNVAYKLALPPHLKVHPVFHVSQLEAYRTDGRYQPPPPEVVIDGIPEYEVAAIKSKRIGRGGKISYLVSWKGYGPEHDTWEPLPNLRNAQDVVAEFEATTRRRSVREGRSVRTSGRRV
jgi:hypothetical protein